MSHDRQIVTAFGSSRPREGDAAYGEAKLLGSLLASEGFSICCGGYGGVMEAICRGAKEAGGRTIGVTAEAFANRANRWVDEEVHVKTWQDRLFELIRRGSAYVACAGGTGTLAELAVVWEMLNKKVMPLKPFVALGDFWLPIIHRVREIEVGHPTSWTEADNPLIHIAETPKETCAFVRTLLRQISSQQSSNVIR